MDIIVQARARVVAGVVAELPFNSIRPELQPVGDH